MATSVFLKDLAVNQALGDLALIEALTEQTPILNEMPMIPSNRGQQHLFREVQAITGGDVVTTLGTRTSCKTVRQLQALNLNIVGGEIVENIDIVDQLGGWMTYLEREMSPIMRETGASLEASIIYNNLRAAAITNGKYSKAGGSNNTNDSIVAVTWNPGETCGVYDPAFSDGNNLFKWRPLYGGGIGTNYSTGVKEYGTIFDTTIGVMLGNSRQVAAVTNIDVTNATVKLPTAAMMDKMLVDCRANANTRIYCHPRIAYTLGEVFKLPKIQMTTTDGVYSHTIFEYNGVRIVPSFNFTHGAETNVA